MLNQSGKFLYTIRSANGVIVKNLKIYGKNREDADEKIRQMYMRCDILSCEVVTSRLGRSSNYEDVLNAIVSSH